LLFISNIQPNRSKEWLYAQVESCLPEWGKRHICRFPQIAINYSILKGIGCIPVGVLKAARSGVFSDFGDFGTLSCCGEPNLRT
jgi:hypothetical protein